MQVRGGLHKLLRASGRRRANVRSCSVCYLAAWKKIAPPAFPILLASRFWFNQASPHMTHSTWCCIHKDGPLQWLVGGVKIVGKFSWKKAFNLFFTQKKGKKVSFSNAPLHTQFITSCRQAAGRRRRSRRGGHT